MVQHAEVNLGYENEEDSTQVERGDFFIVENPNSDLSRGGDPIYRVAQVDRGKVLLISLDNANRVLFEDSDGPEPIEDVTLEWVEETLEFLNPDNISHVKGGNVVLNVEVRR